MRNDHSSCSIGRQGIAASCGGKMRKRDRLSLRIPWLFDAVAEGPLAIIMLFVLAFIMIAAKSFGWL
jgi:hypothetical protein